jgi:hypothetical protein
MIRKIALLSFLPILLVAKEGDLPDDESKYPAPWFTGPLEAASGNVIPVGHYNLEPYVNLYIYSSSYDNDWKAQDIPTLWSLNPQFIIEVGLTPWMDFQITPSWFWNYREGSAHWEMGDWVVQFDFQLHQDQLPHIDWLPSIKLTLRETIPLGRYRNLIFKNQRTDIGGAGSWVSGAALVFSKLLRMYDIHYFNTRLSLEFNWSAPVHVKSFNSYGGGYGTNGTAYPGLNYQIDAGFEYNLTRNWALALDIIGNWNGGGRFSGTPGVLPNGAPASNVFLASAQYSLAPAIEYNWSDSLGVIAGSWFTVAGRNSPQFSSIIIALNYFN